jgi:hypothetical protein
MAKRGTKVDEAARRAQRAARRTQEIAERSRLDFEIRFAKTQQIAAATGAMALLGTVVGVGHLLRPLYCWEKWLGGAGALAIAIVGSVFILSLHRHLAKTRRQIDPRDSCWRGFWVSFVLAFVLVIGAIVVIYTMVAPTREIFFFE